MQRPRKLREPLDIGEKVLALAERLKKKDAPGKLYKAQLKIRPFSTKIRYLLSKKELKQHLTIGIISLQNKILK